MAHRERLDRRHLIVAPILLPLLDGALMLLLRGAATPWKALVNVRLGRRWASLVGRRCCAGSMRHGVPGAVGVYLPANWDVPFGIVLAVDRLSALMLLLTGDRRPRRAAVRDWRAGTAPACTSIRCSRSS